MSLLIRLIRKFPKGSLRETQYFILPLAIVVWVISISKNDALPTVTLAGLATAGLGVAMVALPSAWHGIERMRYSVDALEQVAKTSKRLSTAPMMLAGAALIAIGGVMALSTTAPKTTSFGHPHIS